MDMNSTANDKASGNPGNSRSVDASPYAGSLIEGLRDVGYSIETALSDIIDNSLTAGATNIDIVAEPAADTPWIAIADNGVGMSEAELIDAMRLGSKNPLNARESGDLGRFGLGLKSASFSQCRRLTVLTRLSEGSIACARWDLDVVARHNSWYLELIDNHSDVPGGSLLGSHGTVVVWENLDRVTADLPARSAKLIEHINAELARAERHLRLVFHRFIESAQPICRISLNERRLTAIDPMVSSHPACQQDPEEVLAFSSGSVRIRCFTLPHHNKMSAEDWEESGGPEGHLKTQGFYVYREDRLIIAGSWLGLARQTELTKLCRIRVDIPNTMDADWKIDVKKASAQLPPGVRARLKHIVERFVSTSKRTYRRKGRSLVQAAKFPIWVREQKDGHVVFKPNLDHPVFESFVSQLADPVLQDAFRSCLRVLGSGLPVDAMFAEMSGGSEKVVSDTVAESDMNQVVATLGETLISYGTDVSKLEAVMQSHPFLRENWQVAEPALSRYINGVEK